MKKFITVSLFPIFFIVVLSLTFFTGTEETHNFTYKKEISATEIALGLPGDYRNRPKFQNEENNFSNGG